MLGPAGVVDDRDGLRARVSACLGSDFSAAVTFFGPEQLSQISASEVRCVEGSGDCATLVACLGLSGPACAAEDRCEDGVAVRCFRLPNGITSEVRQRCGEGESPNSRCSVVDDQGKGIAALCNVGPCLQPRCQGDVAVACIGDVEIQIDCAAQGRRCAIDEGGPSCVLPATCQRDHCDGGAAVLCRAGAVRDRYDCAAIIPDGRCRDRNGLVECVAPVWDPACPTDEPYASWCEGDAGVTCNGGVRFEVDCPSFLGGTCVEDDNASRARCRIKSWP